MEVKMQYVFIAAGVILIITAILSVSAVLSKRKLINLLRLNFGKTPKRKFDQYDMESVSAYWQQKKSANETPFAVDDTTWADLDMDGVFKRINNTCSSVGEEVLFDALHEQAYDAKKLFALENAVRYFDEHEAERIKVQFHLSRLGKISGNGLIDFICNPSDKALPNHLIYPLLSLAAVLSVVSLFFNLRMGIFFLVLILVTNIVVYYKTKYNLEAELACVHYISSMIVCAKKISGLSADDIKDDTLKLAKAYAPLKKVSRLTSFVLNKSSSDLDFLFEYVKIFFLLDFVMYNRAVTAISKHLKQCRELYETVGFLDMAIAVASYRRSVAYYSVPEFTGSSEIAMRGIVHPLLIKPVANTVTLKRGSLITGSNASGKSTFVKAMAINTILAQTINTCLAESFCIQPSFVVTSMAVSDSIEAGESYYIAEIKSLKRVLDGLSRDIRCLCFIDEILKGTNTIERIAASAAILSYLSDKNCFAVVATHDIELTEMTAALFDNYHFQEHITSSGIDFDYTIYEGWATTKNAIQLLNFMAYDPSITAKANELAGGFEKNRAWQKL
jgi:hypothetical protein